MQSAGLRAVFEPIAERQHPKVHDPAQKVGSCEVLQLGDSKLSTLGTFGRKKNRALVGFILVLLCTGMLSTEIHGILGHQHSVSLSACNSSSAQRTISARQVNSADIDSNDASCSLCYFYRLLGQSLIPHPDCLIDLTFSIDLPEVKNLPSVHAVAFTKVSRSPPLV